MKRGINISTLSKSRGPYTLTLCLAAGMGMLIETSNKCSIILVLKWSHWMIPKQHRSLQDYRYPIYVLLASVSSKFQTVSLYGFFFIYMPFGNKFAKWFQNDPEQYEIKISYISSTSMRKSQFSLRFVPHLAISKIIAAIFHFFPFATTLTFSLLSSKL